jgi:hypothetical protein
MSRLVETADISEVFVYIRNWAIATLFTGLQDGADIVNKGCFRSYVGTTPSNTVRIEPICVVGKVVVRH